MSTCRLSSSRASSLPCENGSLIRSLVEDHTAFLNTFALAFGSAFPFGHAAFQTRCFGDEGQERGCDLWPYVVNASIEVPCVWQKKNACVVTAVYACVVTP